MFDRMVILVFDKTSEPGKFEPIVGNKVKDGDFYENDVKIFDREDDNARK